MIYAFNKSSEPTKIAESLIKNSVSRFGWGYVDNCNLLEMSQMQWTDMDEHQVEIWNKTNFLLGIKKGDWIVHINTPTYGECIAAMVDSEYYFDIVGLNDDYRHCIPINPDSIIQFNRNGQFIHPAISRRLKLQGHYWRIYKEAEFLESIESIKKIDANIVLVNKEIYHLKNDVEIIFNDLTKKIQLTHPEKKLEHLICEIIRNVPNVKEAYVNSVGWGSDNGADIIVKYNSGLDILSLQKQETLVIQVKSYVGAHSNLNCVNQLRNAIEVYNANCAMLVTTAQSTPQLETAINELSANIEKPIAIMAGGDVAKFVLKFENSKLIEF